MKIGLVGGGVMGMAIAKRLIETGTSLIAFNRTKSKLIELEAAGAVVVDSLQIMMTLVEFILICVSDAAAIRDIAATIERSNDNLHNEIKVINLSTVGAKHSQDLEQVFRDKGVKYIDMPVSGGPEGALNGTLAAYIGNISVENEAFSELIGSISNKTVFFGNNQLAQSMKVLNNLCEAINLWGAAEATSIALRAGIEMPTIVEGLSLGRGNSVYLQVLLDRISNPSNFTAVSLAIRIKDLELALELANEIGGDIPLTNVVHNLFSQTSVAFGVGADQTECHRYLLQKQ